MWVIRNQYFQTEFWTGESWADLKAAKKFESAGEATLTAVRVGGVAEAVKGRIGQLTITHGKCISHCGQVDDALA